MKQFLMLLMAFSFLTMSAQKREQQGWHVENYNETSAKQYFDNNYYLDRIEGIWQSTDGFKYAIEKDVENGRRNNNKFRMIILESSANVWKTSEIKGFIDYGSINEVYSLKYYTKNLYDGSNLSSENVLLVLENALIMNFQRLNGEKITLYKLYPKSDNFQSQNQVSPEQQIEQWSGSCVAIGNNMVATNYHVVENALDLVVSGTDKGIIVDYTAEVVLTDKYNDLAILKIIDPRFKGFTIKYGINSKVADIGTSVFVLGYPLTTTMGEDIKLTTGIISSKTGFQGDVSQYQISAPIQPGNSGGPLFDNQGNLIGIVSAKHIGAENVGYAIKLSYLINLIESSNDPIIINMTNDIFDLPLTEKVKKITPCVLMIKANTKSINYQKKDITSMTPESNQDNIRKAQSLYETSYQKFQENDYEGAYEYACKSAVLYPTPTSQYMIGYLAYFLRKDTENAIKALEYCIKQNYMVDECNALLSRLYYLKEDYDISIVFLNKILARNRKDINALALRAQCKHMKNNKDGAMQDYLEAIKYDGIVEYDYSNIYNNIAFYTMQEGDLEKSLDYIKKSIKHNHMYGNAWDTYGELNYKTGDYTSCIDCMNKAIIIGKVKQSAHWLDNSYLYRGLAKKQLNDLAGAYKDFERASELGNETASEELAKMDASQIDFSEDKAYNIIIQQPTITKRSSDSNIQIKGIEITDEYTAIYFSITNTEYEIGGWYAIYADAYIRDKSNGKKQLLVATENCEVMPHKKPLNKGETQTFTVYFAPISKDAKQIDFVEADNSKWKFYGIKLK